MRLDITLAILGALVSITAARVLFVAIPETVKPGEPFDAILMADVDIHPVLELAVAFGIAQGEGKYDRLGTVLDTAYLGPGMFVSYRVGI